MDCSLALTSQGIEHVIDSDESGEFEAFWLRVAAADSDQARGTLARFREENRRWSWRRPFVKAHLAFRWSSVIWCAVLGVFGYLPLVRPVILDGGILDSARVFDGEYWRLLTATMLHRDIAHLFSNLSAGLLLFGLVMGRFGVGLGLLGIVATGVGGNVVGLAFHVEPYRGLGASGAVMGALGMLGPHALGLVRRHAGAYRLVVSGLLAVTMLFVLFGLSPESDVVAHFGGFLCGLVLGGILSLCPDRIFQRPPLELLSGTILLGGLLWAWGKAVALF